MGHMGSDPLWPIGGLLARFLADPPVQLAQRINHRVDGPRAGLEQRGCVDGGPAETLLDDLMRPCDHGFLVRVERFALRIGGRNVEHRLRTDRRWVAARCERRILDGLTCSRRAVLTGVRSREPTIAVLADALVRGWRSAADPDR